MGDVPITVFLMPVIAVGVVLFLLWQRRNALAAAKTMHQDFLLGTLAPRLGLQLTSGDPSANLMLPPHNAVGTRIAPDKPYEWNVRMQGAPRGRPVDVLYFHRREVERGFAESKYTYYDDAYVGVQLRVAVPDFEVVSKSSTLGAIARRHPLPVQTFGDPGLDREFALATNDARVGPCVAPFLGRFDPNLRGYGVHLECSGGWLRFRADGKHVSGVMYFVTSIVPALEEIADRLEQP
jgi:hypothetical protein